MTIGIKAKIFNWGPREERTPKSQNNSETIVSKNKQGYINLYLLRGICISY